MICVLSCDEMYKLSSSAIHTHTYAMYMHTRMHIHYLSDHFRVLNCYTFLQFLFHFSVYVDAEVFYAMEVSRT